MLRLVALVLGRVALEARGNNDNVESGVLNLPVRKMISICLILPACFTRKLDQLVSRRGGRGTKTQLGE